MSRGLAAMLCRQIFSSAAALNYLEPSSPPSPLPAFRSSAALEPLSASPHSLLPSSIIGHLASLKAGAAPTHLVGPNAGAAPSITIQDTPNTPKVLVLVIWDWENNGLKDEKIDQSVRWIKRNLSDAGIELDDMVSKICVGSDYGDEGTIAHFRREGQKIMKGISKADNLIVDEVAKFRKGAGKEGHVILLSGDYILAKRVASCIGKTWKLYIGCTTGNLAKKYYKNINPTLVWEWSDMGVGLSRAMTKAEAQEKQKKLQQQQLLQQNQHQHL